jgi:hypothetical protein
MPKKSYVLHNDDKFGIVTRAQLFSRTMIAVETWERNRIGLEGCHKIGTDEIFQMARWLDAVKRCDDRIYPSADGMGTWRDFTSPDALAREFWPQDYKHRRRISILR